MKTVNESIPALDQDLYVLAVARWQARNGPRRPARVEDIQPPCLDRPEPKEEPETEDKPYRPAYIIFSICSVIVLGLVLISLGGAV